mmetsp:Transcript_45627/g.99347  ORF Transcript_45627/g.99347 Transcript_45627/m.99347 type:complete len:86 (+) Transcript_45627:81-338(+)|eukprot:1936978-Pleurochrysis_carterae.AAC.7
MQPSIAESWWRRGYVAAMEREVADPTHEMAAESTMRVRPQLHFPDFQIEERNFDGACQVWPSLGDDCLQHQQKRQRFSFVGGAHE